MNLDHVTTAQIALTVSAVAAVVGLYGTVIARAPANGNSNGMPSGEL